MQWRRGGGQGKQDSSATLIDRRLVLEDKILKFYVQPRAVPCSRRSISFVSLTRFASQVRDLLEYKKEFAPIPARPCLQFEEIFMKIVNMIFYTLTGPLPEMQNE